MQFTVTHPKTECKAVRGTISKKLTQTKRSGVKQKRRRGASGLPEECAARRVFPQGWLKFCTRWKEYYQMLWELSSRCTNQFLREPEAVYMWFDSSPVEFEKPPTPAETADLCISAQDEPTCQGTRRLLTPDPREKATDEPINQNTPLSTLLNLIGDDSLNELIKQMPRRRRQEAVNQLGVPVQFNSVQFQHTPICLVLVQAGFKFSVGDKGRQMLKCAIRHELRRYSDSGGWTRWFGKEFNPLRSATVLELIQTCEALGCIRNALDVCSWYGGLQQERKIFRRSILASLVASRQVSPLLEAGGDKDPRETFMLARHGFEEPFEIKTEVVENEWALAPLDASAPQPIQFYDSDRCEAAECLPASYREASVSLSDNLLGLCLM
ncbi:MAG: uncharacterized protein KVP18_002940 [Porospora cf. gigantea A]|uniref:uncharacterized protein n=1 Tax=Porospora cf. gigantea A TaxID=2853593 RepID=UPI00355A3BD4|nr:MAG: hypothetical protein KVP18_002940 [Porospora cf. gigantea A]